MAKLTQGTQLYLIDPADDSVVTIEGVTTFNPGGNPADQIEDTPLEAHTRAYLPGLRTPGQASIGLNVDPEKESHVRMHELAETDPSPTLKWALGWSDGTEPPTVDVGGEFVLPTSRTWCVFDGYISDFPFDFTGNAVVTSSVSVQRTGGLSWTKKVVV